MYLIASDKIDGCIHLLTKYRYKTLLSEYLKRIKSMHELLV